MITWPIIALLLIGFLVLAVILRIFWLKWRAEKNVIAQALIDIYPSGECSVQFVPSTGIHSMDAVQLAISYMANILYVTSESNSGVAKPIRNLIDYNFISHSEEEQTEQEYREGLLHLVSQLQVNYIKEGRTRVNEPDHYEVKLIRGINMDYSLSTIPISHKGNNLSYSALILYCQIAQKVDDAYLGLLYGSFMTLIEASVDKKLTMHDNQSVAYTSVEFIFQTRPDLIKNSPERASKNRKIDRQMAAMKQKYLNTK